ATPDAARNASVRALSLGISRCSPVASTIAQANASTTAVRSAVARFDGTPSTPSLARIAVAPAKAADKSANTSQLPMRSSPLDVGSTRGSALRRRIDRANPPLDRPPETLDAPLASSLGPVLGVASQRDHALVRVSGIRFAAVAVEPVQSE